MVAITEELSKQLAEQYGNSKQKMYTPGGSLFIDQCYQEGRESALLEVALFLGEIIKDEKLKAIIGARLDEMAMPP